MFVETASVDRDPGEAAHPRETCRVVGRVAERRLSELEARIAVVCGQLNSLHGELVELIGEALECGAAEGHGLRSAGHWVSWVTGSSTGHGAALATLARRRCGLPVTTEALRAGRISIDQATTVARHAPDFADREAAGFAESMTPAQLSRVCRHYPTPDGAEPRRHRYGVSASTTDDGDLRLAALLPADQGELVRTALRAHLDALVNDWKRTGSHSGTGDADDGPAPTMVDALIRMADRSLATDAVDRPHHHRHKVLVHVDIATPHAQLHLGPALPIGLRRLLSCDATYQVVYERDGTPIGVGRTRDIPTRLRVAIELRDGGCRVPGCRSSYVQIHHVHHHEDGGATETPNLIALCPHHHRMHHTELLGIHGSDADDPGGISFTNAHGRTIHGVHPPIPPPAGLPPPTTEPYVHPEGTRLDPRWVTLNATPPSLSS